MTTSITRMALPILVAVALAPLEAAGDTARPAKYSLQTKCAHPELFLTTEPLAKVKDILIAKCGVERHSNKLNRFSTRRCEVKNFLRNAIFAAHGKKFRKEKWKKVFGLAVWYRPSDSYDDSLLSRRAWRNVKALRKGCVETAQFRKDEKLLKRWLKALHKKQHRTAGALMAFPFHSTGEVEPRCQKLTGASAKLTECLTGYRESKELIAGWSTSPWVIYSDRAEFSFFQEDLERRGVDLKGTRVMRLNFVPGDLACQMDVNPKHTASFIEDCGGYGLAVTVFISRKNKIVAAHWDGGAACPYVYLKGADGLALQGEILRNVVGSHRYTSQTLPIRLREKSGDVIELIELIIREEKDETTYADDATLKIAGLSIRPLRCASERHPLCARDRRYHIMKKGEEIVLRFQIPRAGDGAPMNVDVDSDIGDVTLRMSGFYIPVASPAGH